MNELSFDDLLEDARNRRDAGAAASENSLHTGWRLWAEDELDRLIDSGREFSADDLRAVCGDPPDGEHTSGVGGLFLRASKQGRIVMVGFKSSTRPEARGHALRVWRGTGRSPAHRDAGVTSVTPERPEPDEAAVRMRDWTRRARARMEAQLGDDDAA